MDVKNLPNQPFLAKFGLTNKSIFQLECCNSCKNQKNRTSSFQSQQQKIQSSNNNNNYCCQDCNDERVSFGYPFRTVVDENCNLCHGRGLIPVELDTTKGEDTKDLTLSEKLHNFWVLIRQEQMKKKQESQLSAKYEDASEILKTGLLTNKNSPEKFEKNIEKVMKISQLQEMLHDSINLDADFADDCQTQINQIESELDEYFTKVKYQNLTNGHFNDKNQYSGQVEIEFTNGFVWKGYVTDDQFRSGRFGSPYINHVTYDGFGPGSWMPDIREDAFRELNKLAKNPFYRVDFMGPVLYENKKDSKKYGELPKDEAQTRI